MNAPARDWSYQCGCQGGADLVCPPGTSEYERATGHEWCNAHGVSTCDNAMCLRKGLSCYRKAGDFWTGDPCTDKATRIACCDPTGNGAEAHLCPPGYCKGSDLCNRELFNLCNSDAGFAAFPDICKTFAWNNRTRPEFNLVQVAKKWCADPSNAALFTTGYPNTPGGFCSCFTAFGKGSNYVPSAGLDLITGHPTCYNGGCAQYGYDDPATINAPCPTNICIQVVDLVAGGIINMDGAKFNQSCPGHAYQLIKAQQHATKAELQAAELEHCHLVGNCSHIIDFTKTTAPASGAPAAPASDAPASGAPPAAPKKSSIHP
ncbi:MAG: hypothetical protein EBU23_16245, partial [Mycobacteriaceae bacterium]|nr:hypothetical protein [Mycobacteriaceae bacterium]